MPKLLFLSESCLFDQSSGAAHSARAMLHALAAAGWDVQAATLNLCDGNREYPLTDQLPNLAGAAVGQAISVDDGPVLHEIMLAQSTQIAKLRPWDFRAFHQMALARLRAFRPDIVLTYCSAASYPLLANAQRLGAQTVFYVANPGVIKAADLQLSYVDHVIAPSQWLADLCAAKLYLPTHVVGDIVQSGFTGQHNATPQRIAARADRYVTMVNPAASKGGLFFINIAAQMATLAPQVKFRAIESRWMRQNWADLGVSAADLDRIDWHPHSTDMAAIYADAALLLAPSLADEASGRVIFEAMLSGLPVLAMRNGGIPEQVGEGGILFDLPADLAQNHLAPPDKADLIRWAQFIKVLMENDALYAQAVTLALREGPRIAPQARAASAVQTFQGIHAAPMDRAAGGDAQVIAALSAFRAQMAQLRNQINADLENAPRGDIAHQPADTPYLPLLQRSLAQPAVKQALAAATAKQWPQARAILQPYLRLVPDDLTALALLAEVSDAQDRESETRELLEQIVTLAPGFLQGQQRLLAHLRRHGDSASGLTISAGLLARAPDNPRYQALHAGLLVAAGEFDAAIALYETCFADYAGSAPDWMQYGLALKTVGQQAAGIAAYRTAIARAPKNGQAWHGLSNMKLAVFSQDDIAVMQDLIASQNAGADDLANVHFTLGKAYEDARDYANSFTHYAAANQTRRAERNYDVGIIEDFVGQAKETFTAEFFAQRAGFGDTSRDPIFVLGLHRAGSTLTEQILASHSQIEGTRELPYMLQLGRYFHRGGLAVDLLRDLDNQEAARLGQRYLALCQPERHTNRPLFVDKMPANWMYTGLIHLFMPNAKIIDIRRKPMAAGFALFKMNFGQGVDHSYDQVDIARYYRAYVDLMQHFDTVLPNVVHHIEYETLVADTDSEIRRLIAYCDIPFEAGCLRYWETERAIQTPSSEQVRQPIFQSGVDQWTNYAPWLGPMRDKFAQYGLLPAGD